MLTFGQDKRLNSSEFKLLLRQGKRLPFKGGVCFFIPHKNSTSSKLGISIAKRFVNKSTARNKLKRIFREHFRTHQNDIPPSLILFMARGGADKINKHEYTRALNKIWNTLKK